MAHCLALISTLFCSINAVINWRSYFYYCIASSRCYSYRTKLLSCTPPLWRVWSHQPVRVQWIIGYSRRRSQNTVQRKGCSDRVPINLRDVIILAAGANQRNWNARNARFLAEGNNETDLFVDSREASNQCRHCCVAGHASLSLIVLYNADQKLTPPSFFNRTHHHSLLRASQPMRPRYFLKSSYFMH